MNAPLLSLAIWIPVAAALLVLAAALGMSKSGLFAHFQSKEDLQVEILKAAQARLTDDGILFMQCHTDGDSLVWSWKAHDEMSDAFADIAHQEIDAESRPE